VILTIVTSISIIGVKVYAMSLHPEALKISKQSHHFEDAYAEHNIKIVKDIILTKTP
jgi:hypothetical protein